MQSIYRILMQRRRAANLQRRAQNAVPCPIVSVGNLTTGGTGKTPAVQWLARVLAGQNLRVGIAARGYGGQLSASGALVSDGKTCILNVAQAGDEAILHARALPSAIVAIAKDRHRAVEMCAKNGAQVVILDDGFQFWSLPRDFDLVLLDAKRPFGNWHLLPRGRLREEPQALSRADAILLTRADRASEREVEYARELISEFTQAPIFTSSHAPRALRDEKTGADLSLKWLSRQRIKAFAGLADNTQFYDLLRALGAGPIVQLQRERGDHHAWKRGEFYWFQNAQSINQHQKEIFDELPVVTTEKDAVKVDPSWFQGPLLSLQIALEIEEESELQKLLFEKLPKAT
jgi:tetraacyldisaccharide 4'-kinase